MDAIFSHQPPLHDGARHHIATRICATGHPGRQATRCWREWPRPRNLRRLLTPFICAHHRRRCGALW